jgi:iron complex outermembrane recepter protein
MYETLMRSARARDGARAAIPLLAAMALGWGAPLHGQQSASIRGSVVSATHGAALADVDVFLEGSGRRALTDRSGSFLFTDLQAGRHVVVAERLGFGTARQEVAVSPGAVAEVTLRMEDRAISIPEVVVIASRDAKSLSEVAASVGVVGSTAIREAQPGHPSEVMGQVPGVYVNVTGGEGHMTAIRQPLTTDPVYLFLEDGVPTRSTGFFNHNALYEVNVPQADRIEVMKGPANAMYGSDGIGGVVNVGTRAPSREATGELSVEGGAHGFQRYLGSVSGTSGANGLRLDGNVTLSDGWRAGTDYERYSGTLRWDRQLGAGTSLRSVATYSRIDQSTAGTSAISRDDFESNPTVNYTPISFREVGALRLSSALEHRTSDWTWSVTGFGRMNRMDILPNWSLTFDPAVWETENSSLGVLANARWNAPSAPLAVTAGLDVDYSPGSRVERTIVPTNDGGIFTSYAEGVPIYDYDVSFMGLSPYVHAEATPTDRVHLSAGLRLDRLGYDYTNHLGVQTSGQHRRPADGSPSYSALSPKVGLTVNAAERLDVFASFRRGFRAPSEGQLFRQGSAENTIDLAPVVADSWEIGMRGGIGGAFRYELSGYWMTKSDDILSYRLPDGSTQSVNAGETLHKGVEMGVGVRLASGLDVDAAYSLADHTYEEWQPNPVTDYGGNEQEFAPNEVGSARLRIAPPSVPGAQLTLEWSRIGPYWMDATNENEYEGHHLFNARLSYAMNEHLRLFGRLNNVLDQRYAERASYNAFRGEELAPGLPRSLYLGVEVR